VTWRALTRPEAGLTRRRGVRACRNDFYIPRLQNILEDVHAAFFAALPGGLAQSPGAAAGTGTPGRPKGLGMGPRSGGGLSMGGRGAAPRGAAGAAGAAGVRDVRVLLREAQARVLAGVRIVFSGVYRARCADWRRACAWRAGTLRDRDGADAERRAAATGWRTRWSTRWRARWARSAPRHAATPALRWLRARARSGRIAVAPRRSLPARWPLSGRVPLSGSGRAHHSPRGGAAQRAGQGPLAASPEPQRDRARLRLDGAARARLSIHRRGR
jgi:hypothetical protein